MIKPGKRVSILLSCFKGCGLIERYVDFLTENNIADYCTLIAINFPGSHAKPGFVEQQLKRFPDLILLNQSQALSLYDAWNIGIKHAATEFVSNLNLDDRVSADYYRFGVERLDQYEADVFSSFSIMTSEIGRRSTVSAQENHLTREYFDEHGVAKYGLAELLAFHEGKVIKRNVPHCAPIWRRKIHEDVGYFDSHRFDFAADYEFWLRCAAANKKFIVSNQHKTLFFTGEATASDRLQHEENASIIDYWQASFPGGNYQAARFGEWHHKIHYCMNMNCVFSSRKYFNHLAEKLVSVVVVAHQNPVFLMECLHSIQTQTYPLFECIVVLDNDHSNSLRKFLEDTFAYDARFLLVSLNGKRERNYCRNLGIELATGSWVTIVDGDDCLPRDSLAIRVAAATVNQGDIVYGRMQTISDRGEIEIIQFADCYRYRDLRISWPTHCTLMIKKEFLSETRYPAAVSDCVADPALIAGEDVKFMFELLKKNPAAKFVNCFQNVYTYRRHFSSSYKKRYLSIQQVINTIISYHGEPGDDDFPYKNTMIERSVGYFFWLGYALWNEQKIASLAREADEKILNLYRQASFDQFEKAKTRFLADLVKLNTLDENEAIRLVDTVRTILGSSSKNQHPSSLAPKRPGQPRNRYKPEAADYRRLYRWKNRHRGENCILMCNGPSLNRVDFNKIDTANYVLFGLNKIFLGFEGLAIAPKYIAAVNAKVIEQSLDVYQNLDIVKFLGSRTDPSRLPQNPFTYFINTTHLPPNPARFSTEISAYVHEGWTVTHVALQLIYYMGFSNVYIIGMDHRFSQHVEGQENQVAVIEGDDIDHFHPEYFGRGQSWDLPDLENSEISYKSALRVFRESGRAIYDCTIAGACTIFPKLDISAIYSESLEQKKRARNAAGILPERKSLVLPNVSITRKICYFPAFSSEDDINFSMVRAAWYLGCIAGAEITVFTDSINESLDCYDYYDPATNTLFQQLRTTGRLIDKPFLEPQELVPALHGADIIICWKDHAYIEDLLGRDELGKLIAKGKKIYRAGASNPVESSIYIEISKDLSAFTSTLISACRKKFEQLYQRLKGKENAFLFATGPSSKSHQKYRYGGPHDVSIICNSVINDEEMLAAVRPDILVFADPIFHFGCSTYAQAFRAQLLKVCDNYDFAILIPIKYYPIFTFHMPALKDRVIGIPHYKDKGINLDLHQHFFINTTSNILTYLMLPIGASVAKNLYVIGCDGRPLEEDDYFWGHNAKTQFPGEMGASQRAHPSFFSINYNEYYLAHCQLLEDYAKNLEENDQRLYSMWGSHIPALVERLRVPDRLKTDRVVISINPDLSSNFGHWAHYDRRLAETTEDLFITLANRKLSINPVEFFTIPTFSDDVFAIKNNFTEETRLRLADQFSRVVDGLVSSLGQSTQLRFIMYSGDITYIDALEAVFSHLGSRATLSLNLFYSHFDYDVSSGGFVRNASLYDRLLSPDYLQHRPWLKLFIDSAKMQSILQQKFDIRVGMWPMVNLDVNRRIVESIGPKPERKEQRVVFPGNGQMAKGFDLACDFILQYGQQLSQKYHCRFVLRNMLRDSPENNAIMEQKLNQLSPLTCVDILPGTLSEEEFLKLFYHADFIVLPYRRSSFYSRTSSCVVNAVLSGVPVLVTDDSWLSEQINRFHAGLTFADGDINALFAAFCHLVEDFQPPGDLEQILAHYSSKNILPAIL